jgi:DNA-binding transcriptional LysR family regulator
MENAAFDLRLLRQFVVLAEECHYGRAAARLHMTQPPLTQAVQRLEVALGARLFERTQRRVGLSAAGTALLPLARRLLELADTLPGAVQAAAAGLSGQLRLAFVSSIAYGPLPAWLGAFRAAFPDVAVALQEATGDVQAELFAAGDIDAGFVLHAPEADGAPPGFERLTVLDEPLVLALPEHHPAAAGPAAHARAGTDAVPSLRWSRIVDEPLVIFPRRIAPSLFDALAAAYRAAGRTMPVAQEAIQMQTIVNLVSGGMGVAWVPASVMRLQRPGVRYARVTGAPALALRARTSLVWAPGASPVVQRFVAHVRAAPAGASDTPGDAVRRKSASGRAASGGGAGLRRQSAPTQGVR